MNEYESKGRAEVASLLNGTKFELLIVADVSDDEISP